MQARRFQISLIVAFAALGAAFALELVWMQTDALRLKAALAHLGSAIAFLGVVAGLVAATDRSAGVPQGCRWLPPTAMVLNGLFAVATVLLVQVGLPVPPPEGDFYRAGSALPEFEVPLLDTEEKPVALSDFRGEPLVLVFYRGPW